MTKVIHKQVLELTTTISVDEESFRPLRVMIQEESVCLWYETVNSPVNPRDCTIFVVGTGNPVPSKATYVDSVIDGPFVWHIYYKF